MSTRIGVVIPCYRDSERAGELAEMLSQQQLPPNTVLDIVVVDDGSGGHHAAYLQEAKGDRYRVLALPQNVGRSAARNAGARACSAEYLLFLDSDCTPLDSSLVAAHVRTLSLGRVASTGHICGPSDDFWSVYQLKASIRRARAFNRGARWAGSSTNLAVLKQAFIEIGGFDERYGRYGFEDRDLLIRLASLGLVGWAEGAWVIHRDQLSMQKIFSKLVEAGRYSFRFAEDHPSEYLQLGYGRIDVRHAPLLSWLLCLVGPLGERAASALDQMLDLRVVPLLAKVYTVRWLSAFAYALGTALDWREGRRR